MAPRILDHRGQPMGASDTAYSAASRRARELAAWQPSLASADVEMAGESPTIAARSYDLERNHGVATGAIRVQVDNIVGTGLRLPAKPDYRALGRDKAWADAWDARLRRTGARSPIYRSSTRRVSCTLAARPCCNCARRCWPAMVWPWCFGCRIGRGAKWATAVQSIYPARLSNPDWRTMDARLRDGVEINEYGEPVAYWIRRTHPSVAYLLDGPATSIRYR